MGRAEERATTLFILASGDRYKFLSGEFVALGHMLFLFLTIFSNIVLKLFAII